MNRIFILFIIVLPFHAFAENISCDALRLDLSSDAPTPGFITGMKMNDQAITLNTQTGKDYSYQIDWSASKPSERTYVAKLGNLPIDQTPTSDQVSVMLVKQEEKIAGKDSDGVLTDTHLDTYVLKNCKEIKSEN